MAHFPDCLHSPSSNRGHKSAGTTELGSLKKQEYKRAVCSEHALVPVPEGASLQQSPSVWTHHSRSPSVRNER